MTGVTLDVSIDDKQVQKAFKALSKALAGNTTPVMAAIGAGLVANVHDRFQAAVDPSGKAWAKLNPGYAATKRGPGILREAGMRGGLMGSIAFRAGPDSVEVGANKIHAAVHQFGGVIKPVKASHLVFRLASGPVFARSVTIPARPFLEHFPAKWEPVRRRKCDHSRTIGANSDSIGTEFALGVSAEDARTIAETVMDTLDRATKP